jgi:hypothetical protein
MREEHVAAVEAMRYEAAALKVEIDRVDGALINMTETVSRLRAQRVEMDRRVGLLEGAVAGLEKYLVEPVDGGGE